MKLSTMLAGALIVGALVSCSPAPVGHTPATAQTVTLEVQPRTTDVQVGGTTRFAAVVTGTADTSVLWDVVEPGGGAVDASGAYTAPAATGVFHVRATSVAAPEVQSQGTVNVVAAPVVGVTISPRTPSVVTGGTLTFTAVVANASNAAVTWSVPAAGCGTITQAGVYTAPTAAAVCSVVATSQQDPSRSDVATVTVTAPAPAIVVTLTPSSAASDSCGTVTFSATVSGTTNRAVTWTIQEGDAGGTITPTGVYTAPSSAGTYHVVATSVADASKTAVATIAVTDRILSIAVSPQTVEVPPGGTAQFTATVTTTCGTAIATKTINAMGQLVDR